MAFSILRDTVYRRTHLERDHALGLNDRVVRIMYLEGGANDNNDYDNAVAFVLNNVSATFANTNIPIRRTRVTSVDGDKYRVVILYAHLDYSYTPGPATRLVTRRTRIEGVEWFRLPYNNASPGTGQFDSNGYPSGSLNGVDDNTAQTPRPRPYTFHAAAEDIYVHTILNFDPTSQVRSKIGMFNSDTVIFGGVSYGTETLRFNAVQVDWFEVQGELSFAVDYHFTARPNKWRIQSVYYDNGAGQWQSDEGLPNQTTIFGGNAFPYH